MSADIRAKVRAYVEQQLRRKSRKAAVQDSDSLFVSGLLDSLDALEAIAFLEEQYRIDFSAMGFDLTLLDSIDEITALIEQHAATAQA